MVKRKIGVFTGNRAEYGLLYSLLKRFSVESLIDLQLFVSGAHLDNSFGKTIDSIRQSGFTVTDEIKINMDHDDLYSTTLAIGQGVSECARSFKKWSPDLLVVYGDRFESFSAVVAATQMGIPVAHIEGGDITEGGALDDSIRHAITKLAHLHFTTNEEAKKNVLQLGEESWRVFNVGLPSLDGIYNQEYAQTFDLLRSWNLDLSRPFIVFTQHSVATQFAQVTLQIAPSLAALGHFLKKGVQVFITYPNNDAGGKVIVQKIHEFAKAYKNDLFVVPSLGAFNYHGLLALAKNSDVRMACVGNSSSGIKETAVFGCPTVNIGSRQEGRLRAANLLDVDYQESKIIEAVEKCLYDDSFRVFCRGVKNPYGDGSAAKQIAKILLEISFDERLLTKKTLFSTRKGE